MLKLKLQYSGHLMWRADSLGKILMVGKIEGRKEGDNRGWDGSMASPTQWTWVWVNSGSWWWTEACRAAVHGVTKSQTQLSDWTKLKWLSGKEPACQCRRCDFDPWVGEIPWRRKWQPSPVFLPGKSHEQRSLLGSSPWGHKRVRYYLATEQQQQIFHFICFIIQWLTLNSTSLPQQKR